MEPLLPSSRVVLVAAIATWVSMLLVYFFGVLASGPPQGGGVLYWLLAMSSFGPVGGALAGFVVIRRAYADVPPEEAAVEVLLRLALLAVFTSLVALALFWLFWVLLGDSFF